MIMNEELNAKFCHNNWKLGLDIKERKRLRNYVATQSRAAEENSVSTKNFLLRHTIQVFKLQGIEKLSRHCQLMSRQNSRREHKNMSRQKLHATTRCRATKMKTMPRHKFLCVEKVTNWARIFRDPQFVPRSSAHHLKIYKLTHLGHCVQLPPNQELLGSWRLLYIIFLFFCLVFRAAF